MLTMLLWWEALGYTLAWEKAQAGQSVQWIGCKFDISRKQVVTEIPEDKVLSAAEMTRKILARPVVSTRYLQQYAGKVNFMAGVVITLYPFLAPIWAVIYAPQEARLPPNLRHVVRARPALKWLRSFFDYIGEQHSSGRTTFDRLYRRCLG
jgi:hypothetical protein